MKIRKGNWRISIRSLIRIEVNNYIPKIIIHEKFENKVKWILRILLVIGIATSFFTFDYSTGIVITIFIFIVEQFLERAIFEYSIFFVPNFPDFKIEYEQWLSTGYYVLNAEERYHLLDGLYSYMGPLYKDKEYAENFFNFIKSWNNGEDKDLNNLINISIIHENQNKYTMYLYPNYSQEKLNNYFSKYKEALALKKFGKKQQELVFQFIFWHNNLNKGDFFYRFIEDFQISKTFYFAPFYFEDNQLKTIEKLRIEKYHIKIKSRAELKSNEIEYIYK
jgi:hypothetical protein